MEMKLEVVPIGVTDIDQAKSFYGEKFGFTIDIDQPLGDKRYVQATPPGSSCSISFGLGFTNIAPGAIDGLLLVVTDIQAAYKELQGRGIEITEPRAEPWGAIHCYLSDPDGNRWAIQQKPAR